MNDSELASKANEIDDNKFYDTDDTIKINCRKIFDSFQCDFAMAFLIIIILLRSEYQSCFKVLVYIHPLLVRNPD